MKEVIKIIGVSILTLVIVTIPILSETKNDDIDLESDLKAIEKELQKLEEKVKKQEEEEKQIDVVKEMNKVERLMREIHKDFTSIGTGKKGEEVIARLKKIEQKLQDIISHISLTVQPVVKKENDTIDILEKIIRNWRFDIGNCPSCSQNRDVKTQIMSKKQLQKLLSQLKKQRERERRKSQNKPTAQQPAQTPYDVPPSEPPKAEPKSSSGSGISWGNLPDKIREALEEVEINEIPDDIKEIYKEFKKSLGKEESK